MAGIPCGLAQTPPEPIFVEPCGGEMQHLQQASTARTSRSLAKLGPSLVWVFEAQKLLGPRVVDWRRLVLQDI